MEDVVQMRSFVEYFYQPIRAAVQMAEPENTAGMDSMEAQQSDKLIVNILESLHSKQRQSAEREPNAPREARETEYLFLRSCAPKWYKNDIWKLEDTSECSLF